MLTLAVFASDTTIYAALLEGHQVFARLEHQETSNGFPVSDQEGPVVVGPTLEVNDLGASIQNSVIVDIDFSDTQIVITAVNDQPPHHIENIEMMVFDALNISVSINPATNWAGFAMFPERLGEGNDIIHVNLNGLAGLQGQQIVIDVVPEPAAAGLAAVAGPALLTAHRRRRLGHA
jgi:hypothetical protein